MKELNLYKEILDAKTDNNTLLKLVRQFMPLLKKYAIRMNAEDAYFDLQLDFIEMIHKIDLAHMKRKDDHTLLSYIAKSVYNSFIKRSRIACKYRDNNFLFSDMSEKQRSAVLMCFSAVDDYDFLMLSEYKKYLTPKEFEVMIMIYYYGYGVTEISQLKQVSRQCINQVKLSALNKLHRQFEGVWG
ncbi:MAG: sigma-70 family RNA polymerase sigma factor [Lachnospiraceae bacterium]|nr:sigma-70 family RNA polymerase sigma factor [Lachnospiraceae bacterium]